MFHISTISDIPRQRVDSLAQWLEHWIFTLATCQIPSGTWDFFQTMHHILVTNFHTRKSTYQSHCQASQIFAVLDIKQGSPESQIFPTYSC